ncbi:MAG: hypothetical protein KY437_06780, partial [Actinobacteria bacterium]|nr:hypothetical protein [Actinomycetota bacterium]
MSGSIEPVVAREGWGVLHLFHRVDHAVARTLSPGQVKDLVTTLEELAEQTQLHVFSTFGHKADMMTMVLDEDWTRLRAVQTAIDSSAVA